MLLIEGVHSEQTHIWLVCPITACFCRRIVSHISSISRYCWRLFVVLRNWVSSLFRNMVLSESIFEKRNIILFEWSSAGLVCRSAHNSFPIQLTVFFTQVVIIVGWRAPSFCRYWHLHLLVNCLHIFCAFWFDTDLLTALLCRLVSLLWFACWAQFSFQKI